jgi:hypothetical protein
MRKIGEWNKVKQHGSAYLRFQRPRRVLRSNSLAADSADIRLNHAAALVIKRAAIENGLRKSQVFKMRSPL